MLKQWLDKVGKMFVRKPAATGARPSVPPPQTIEEIRRPITPEQIADAPLLYWHLLDQIREHRKRAADELLKDPDRVAHAAEADRKTHQLRQANWPVPDSQFELERLLRGRT